jgi:hypothetical protein
MQRTYDDNVSDSQLTGHMEIQLTGEYDQRETTARGILVKRADFLERKDAAVAREN